MTLAAWGANREEGQKWGGGGEPFVVSQVQLLGLNRGHPLAAGGRAPEAAAGGWAGSSADMCHSLPRQKLEVLPRVPG